MRQGSRLRDPARERVNTEHGIEPARVQVDMCEGNDKRLQAKFVSSPLK